MRLGRNPEVHFRAGDSRAFHVADVRLYAVETESAWQCTQPLGIESDGNQRPKRHVA